MEAYNTAAALSAYAVIKSFSTSFGTASRLFPKSYRQHIYNIYGMVRLADEIVDSYDGPDAGKYLDDLEREVYHATQLGFSTNLVVHAFADTARTFDIGQELIKPFYASMRVDLQPRQYDSSQYASYIHGSAEVVGLMCLKVFCADDKALYDRLQPGACALGAGFQKVNFLRDLHADYQSLGRYYFPIGSFETFDDEIKQQIIQDIRQDFDVALPAIEQLPTGARLPVTTAYNYYDQLLRKLEAAPAASIRSSRIRISNGTKLRLLASTSVRQRLGR